MFALAEKRRTKAIEVEQSSVEQNDVVTIGGRFT